MDFSKVTFYNYVDSSVLSLTNLDLPKKVKYKKRKERKNNNYKREILILKGRKYEEYLDFVSKHPRMNIVQLDTVIGKTSENKCLLTMYIVETYYMLIFLLNKKTMQDVSNVFRDIKEGLGIEKYLE